MKSSQLPFLDCVKAVRAVSTCSLLSALCLGVIPTAASLQAQQSSGRTGSSSGENHAAMDAARKAVPVTPSEDSPALSSSLNAPDAGVPVSGGASPVVETSGPLHTCDDGVSAAMEVDAAGMPCWANIRTVDHWNSMLIPEGLSFHGAQRSDAPVTGQSSFVYTVGGFSGFVLPDGNEAKVYGGLGAAAGRIQRPRWQLSMEDAGGLGDEQSGGAHLAGLNRFAVRGTGQVSERLSWQANATNTYGTDALREAAPLDYRMIGEAEAPAADTPTYGLHTGQMTDQEEGTKLRYAKTERSHWDFSGTDVYRRYTDTGFSTQTAMVQAEFLHAMTRDVAVGVYGQGAHQTNQIRCTIEGGGGRLLTAWGTHSSLNLSGGLNGASASCGSRAQVTGEAALYQSISTHTDLYASAGRGLGDGALERAVFLNTASAGLRHTFGRQVAGRLSATALQGVDPKSVGGLKNQSLHASFVELGLRYPFGKGLSGESDFRHYSASGEPVSPNRSLLLFTLWWSPEKERERSTR